MKLAREPQSGAAWLIFEAEAQRREEAFGHWAGQFGALPARDG
jgi:hypothetical protein